MKTINKLKEGCGLKESLGSSSCVKNNLCEECVEHIRILDNILEVILGMKGFDTGDTMASKYRLQGYEIAIQELKDAIYGGQE